MTWEETVLKTLREGYAETGFVVDMVLVHEADQTQVLPLQYPTPELQKAALVAARKLVTENRGHIEEVALVATVSRNDAPDDVIVMVQFETKKADILKLFKPKGKELEEMPMGAFKTFIGLGLRMNEPDLGAMYQ